MIIFVLIVFRKIIPILFLIAFLLPDGVKTKLLVSFQLNKKEIVEELCVQRNEVENTCQGSCHLSKQIKEVDAPAEQEKPQELRIDTQVQLFCEVYSVQVQNGFSTEVAVNHVYDDRNSWSSSHLKEVFHPPQIHHT